MKYQDSIAQAEQKMYAAIKQLQLWQVAATPINYAVCYDYLSKSSKQLNQAIDQYLKQHSALDNFFLEQLYRQYVLGQSSLKEEFIDDISQLVSTLTSNNQLSTQQTNAIVSSLDQNISRLKSGHQREITLAIKDIERATQHFKQCQQKMATQLKAAQQQTKKLRYELTKITNEVYLDPLTGLYNRQAMAKHLDLWLAEDPNKQVSAIAINVAKFSFLNQKLGPLISNVLLTKVAQKVISYVDESGLAIRSANDEFLILLPNVKIDLAKEIAEKIRQGVEKLRFVSNKSGIKLPAISLNIGINNFSVASSVDNILQQANASVVVSK